MGKKRIIAETGAGQHGVATVSFSFTVWSERSGLDLQDNQTDNLNQADSLKMDTETLLKHTSCVCCGSEIVH